MVRYYDKKFAGNLPTVFAKRSYYSRFGPMQAYDGIEHNTQAFTLKTNTIPVTIGTYNTGANVAFGTGTNSSSRFGNMVEIKSVDTVVNFTDTWTINEGIDKFTVNDENEKVIAERLVLQAEALTEKFDDAVKTYLGTNAAISKQLTAYTEAAITTLFNELDKAYTNAKVRGVKVAAINSDIYNLIVDHKSTVKEKDGASNVANNTIYKFKDFIIEKVPDAHIPAGTLGTTYIENMGATYTGIETVRTLDARNFVGTEIQGAGKYGVYTLPVNLAAIGKITAPAAG